MSETVEEWLAHHGVKGMKWGVRKAYEKEAKRAYAEYADVGPQAIAFTSREITEEEYKSLSSKPIKISDAKGEFHRVIKTNSAELRDGMAYVTKSEQDRINYTALFFPEGNFKNQEKFSATVTVDKAVISPSLKVRIDTFIETLDKEIPLPDSDSVVKGRAFMTGYLDRANEPPQLKMLGNRELSLKYYQQWVQNQHLDDNLNKAYTKAIKRKGYNSIIDDADAGMLGQMPIILFPEKAGARVTEIKPITKDDVLIAKANIKAPKQINHGEGKP